ncbi:MAG: PEGA domain-containing protein [bacterium]
MSTIPRYQRIILLIIAVLIFLSVASFISFYAAGWRYDFTNNEIVKVGFFYIKASPEDAEVYLDGKLENEKTPHRIKGLLPGDYEIEISKSGYQTWHKTLPVEASLVTTINNVILPRESATSENVINLSPNNLVLNDTATLLAQLSENGKEILIYNLENSDTFSLNLITLFPELENEAIFSILEFSPNNNYLLLRKSFADTISHYLIDLANRSIKIKYRDNISNITFSADSNTVYYLLQNTLHEQNLNGNIIPLISNPDQAFTELKFYNNKLYLLSYYEDSNLQYLWSFTGNQFEPITSFSNANLHLNINKGSLLLTNDSDNWSYVLWFDNLLKLDYNIDNITIAPDKTKFAFSSAGELYVVTNNDKKTSIRFLTRLSKPINNLIWHQDSNNLFYTTSANLNLIEIDTRGQINQFTLLDNLELENNNIIFLNTENIYLNISDSLQKLIYQ